MLGAALVMVWLVGLMGFGISFLATPATEWIEKAPYSLQELKQKMLPIKRPMEKVARAGGAIESLTATDNQQNKTPTVEVKQHPLTDRLMGQTPELMVSALTTLILLYFLLAYDGVFLGKLIKLMPTLSDKKRAVSIAHEIETQVSRYLFTITIINICLGLGVGATVGFLGLPNPLMWGTMVAVAEFHPLSRCLDRHHLHDTRRNSEFRQHRLRLAFPTLLSRPCHSGGECHHAYGDGPLAYAQPCPRSPLIDLLGLDVGYCRVIMAVPILAAFKIFCSHIEPMEPLAEFIS